MSALINRTNHRYGKWTVIRLAGTQYGRGAFWDCRCDCGTRRTVRGCDLASGQSAGCGCGREKHGHVGNGGGKTISKTYTSWRSMWSRCRYKKHPSFHNYGGRGICVCDRWSRFENFLADMGVRPDGTSLDRINGDGNYEPSNCRWATTAEQRANQRVRPRKLITHCPHGHEYIPENTRLNKYGSKLCIICQNAASRKSYEKKLARKHGTDTSALFRELKGAA